MNQKAKNVNTFVDTSNNIFPSFPSLYSTCSRCQSNNFREIKTLEGSLHFAKIICADCGFYQRWQQNPEVSEIHHERIIQIDRLLQSQKSTEWEHQFLVDVRKRRTLSPKQLNKLNQISCRILSNNDDYDWAVDLLNSCTSE